MAVKRRSGGAPLTPEGQGSPRRREVLDAIRRGEEEKKTAD